jgi:hypothetical protein
MPSPLVSHPENKRSIQSYPGFSMHRIRETRPHPPNGRCAPSGRNILSSRTRLCSSPRGGGGAGAPCSGPAFPRGGIIALSIEHQDSNIASKRTQLCKFYKCGITNDSPTPHTQHAHTALKAASASLSDGFPDPPDSNKPTLI